MIRVARLLAMAILLALLLCACDNSVSERYLTLNADSSGDAELSSTVFTVKILTSEGQPVRVKFSNDSGWNGDTSITLPVTSATVTATYTDPEGKKWLARVEIKGLQITTFSITPCGSGGSDEPACSNGWKEA